MKDELDPGTLELSLRKKPGPKPKLGVAMSDAARASNYRSRRASRANLVGSKGLNDGVNLIQLSDAELHDAIAVAMRDGAGERVGMLCDQLKQRFATL